MKELWDAYDRAFHRIPNAVLVRGKPIPAGKYHLVCDVLVRHDDGTYLIMRRDDRKRYGGLWEATAGGSALAGEDPETCAKRELREETGITAEELTEVGRVVSDRDRTLYVEFFCRTGGAKDRVTLQKGETTAYRWVTGEELRKMKADRLLTERMRHFTSPWVKPASGEEN